MPFLVRFIGFLASVISYTFGKFSEYWGKQKGTIGIEKWGNSEDFGEVWRNLEGNRENNGQSAEM